MRAPAKLYAVVSRRLKGEARRFCPRFDVHETEEAAQKDARKRNRDYYYDVTDWRVVEYAR